MKRSLVLWPITASCTAGGALCGSMNSPRPAAGVESSIRLARRSTPGGQTVHVCAEAAAFAKHHLDLTAWEEPR
jgi:hypothetical protein